MFFREPIRTATVVESVEGVVWYSIWSSIRVHLHTSVDDSARASVNGHVRAAMGTPRTANSRNNSVCTSVDNYMKGYAA